MDDHSESASAEDEQAAPVSCVPTGPRYRSFSARSFSLEAGDETKGEVVASLDERLLLVQVYGDWSKVATDLEGKRQGYAFRRAQLVMIPSYSSSWWDTTRVEGRKLRLLVTPSNLEDDRLEAALCKAPPRVDLFSKTLERLMGLIDSELANPGTGSNLYLESLGHAAVVSLARRSSTLNESGNRKGGIAGWQLRKLDHLLRERLTEDVRLDELAKLAGLSKWHFARAFRESTGLAPHAYQLALRLNLAKTLLEKTSLPISQVGEECGFSDPSYFTRIFVRQIGVTPIEFRRRRLL